MRDFKKALRDIGYDIVEVEKGEDIVEKERQEREKELSRLKFRLIAGAALTISIFVLMLWEKAGLSSFIEIPEQINFLIQFIIQSPSSSGSAGSFTPAQLRLPGTGLQI
jgi:hypothetical protein